RHLPLFNKLFYTLIGANSFILVVLPFSRYIALYSMVIFALITFIVTLSAAIICLFRGARQARFYIVGWIIFLTGVSITILERAVVLPYSPLVEYAGQAALTLEVVLLSL